MDGRDVDIVVDCDLLGSFLLNCVLSSLCDDFWPICVIELTISTNDLTWNSSILIRFLSEGLFAGMNFVNRRLLMTTLDPKLLDIATGWSMT